MRGGDYYARAWRLAAVLVLLLTGTYVTASRGGAGEAGAAPAAVKPFSGGPFEASGVAHVPGTDGVLFVDDGT